MRSPHFILDGLPKDSDTPYNTLLGGSSAITFFGALLWATMVQIFNPGGLTSTNQTIGEDL